MGRALFVITLGLLSCFAPSVGASPMEDPSLGGAVFTGPTHGHASSFFVNPAALGLTGRGWHMHFGASGRISSLSLQRQQVAIDNTLKLGPAVDNTALSPGGLLAYYSSFQDGSARFGVALHTPTWQRFPSGEPALGYHSSGGRLVQTMLTLAGSRQWGRFILGVGFSVGFSSLQLKFSRDSALSGGDDSLTGINSDCGGSPCGYENSLAREEYDINVGNRASLGDLADLKNFSASIGIVYRIGHKSWISLGYVALPGAFETLKLSGNAAITRAPRDGGAVEQSNAEIGFGMAQLAFVGYRRPAFGTTELVTDLRWQDWSRHNQFDVRLFGGNKDQSIPEWIPRHRGMKDVWRLSAGIETNDGQPYRFGARLRLETAAVSESRTSPLLVGGESLTIATGTELRLSNHWVFNLGYELSLFPTADVQNSDFDPREQVSCVGSGFDFDSCQAARNGLAISTGAGKYSYLQHGLVLSFRYDSL